MSTDAQDAPDASADDPLVDPADSLPEPPPNDGPADDTPPSFLDKLAAQGLDVSKYKDEDSAAAGIASALQMLGRNTQDAKRTAERLREIEERLGDEGLTRLLEGQATEEPKPNGKPREIISTPQLAQWQSLYEQGTLPEEDKRKYIQRTLQHQAVANDIANGDIPETLMPAIEALVADRLDAFKEEHTQSTAAQRAEEAEVTAQRAFWDSHGKEIWIDPEIGQESGLTPLGLKLQKLYSTHPSLAKMPNGADRLALAYELAAPQSTPVKEPKKAPPAAKHEPGTKAEPVKRDRKSYVAKYGREPTLRQLAIWKGDPVPE